MLLLFKIISLLETWLSSLGWYCSQPLSCHISVCQIISRLVDGGLDREGSGDGLLLINIGMPSSISFVDYCELDSDGLDARRTVVMVFMVIL